MSNEGADTQLACAADAKQEEHITSGVAMASSTDGPNNMAGTSETQKAVEEGRTEEAAQDLAAAAEEAATSSAAVKSEHSEQDVDTIDSIMPTEATLTAEATPSTSPATASELLVHSRIEIGDSESSDEQAKPDTAAGQDDTDFVPPDMEHIVSTGATQDGASSMQALRELVAQARASSRQPREALPPGFGDDDDDEANFSPPAQAQRGEKRKAEVELEKLVQSSAGIDEVKAAAEKSQHPETRTLLQKALSSISGLVSRRPKAEPVAATSSSSAPQSEQPKAEGQGTDSSDDSDDSSDSDSSSSGDSSDDEDDDEGDDARSVGLALAGDDDDDEEGGGASGSIAPATKNEILAPDVEQPTVQELTDGEKQTLRKLGKVHSIVDSVVVVEQDVQQSSKQPSDVANAGSVPVDSTGRQGEREGEYSVLDTGSLLCFEDGKVLGLVFETFGSIHNPMYSIRFSSAAAIDREVVKTGKGVFYLPAQSTYVLTQLLRSIKGSDASNMWDEEVAEDEIDYSDDEQEAEAKRRAKAIRSGKVDDQGNPIGADGGRGNKRQKQGGGQSSQAPLNHSANGSSKQRSGPGNNVSAPVQQNHHNRPPSHPSMSQPRRNMGGPSLPHPPAPLGPASLGPAFPHGIASLPPKPSAGLPSKPTFQSSEASNGNVKPDSQSAPTAPRSRMSTAEGIPGGQSHSRMHSAAASGLPAKPVDAAAAAAASPYRGQAAVVGASSPPHPSRAASMGRPAPAPTGAYAHQGSPSWYAGSGSAPSSTPASPAAPSQHAGSRVSAAYSPGTGPAAPVTAQGGGHYNPAYAAHWQQHGPPPFPPSHASAGMPWNAPQAAYHPPPLHMASGAMSQQLPYGGYVAPHGGSYGAAASWSGQSYPGSHYPGYTDAAAAASQHYGAAGHTNQGHYNPSAQAYGYGGYSAGQGAGGDAYNAYRYGASAPAGGGGGGAVAPSAQDSYDPRSPSMGEGNSSNAPQQQQQQGR
ncbi:related to NAF1 - nuclear assembly factor [Ustilago trichophora]|uniref:H/ACA ribonucleoprotein complex non-core subunit NAF1 n=1 Tax=Ustilago trichophora TaxID=86804 RepID=A0A5C3EAC0_9BASI|nr:related to NAF1 - nuclear assembly factor [Ustilago trichophora]